MYAAVVGPKTWRSIKLVVDTGATFTMLPPDLLMDIGCNPTKSTQTIELSTANGVVVVPIVPVRALKCLGLTIKNVNVVAHHLPSESPVEGLLGLDILERFPPFRLFHQSIQPFIA